MHGVDRQWTVMAVEVIVYGSVHETEDIMSFGFLGSEFSGIVVYLALHFVVLHQIILVALLVVVHSPCRIITTLIKVLQHHHFIFKGIHLPLAIRPPVEEFHAQEEKQKELAECCQQECDLDLYDDESEELHCGSR